MLPPKLHAFRNEPSTNIPMNASIYLNTFTEKYPSAKPSRTCIINETAT